MPHTVVGAAARVRSVHMSAIDQVKQAASFAGGLYALRARRAYRGYLRGDLFAQLGTARGRKDPYPIYDAIRTHGPFVPTMAGNLATADHALCDAVLRSRRFGVRPENAPGPAEAGEPSDLSFLDVNPPDHTRLRRLAAPAFGPKQVAGYRERIESTIAELLDQAAAAGPFDLVPAFAAPLPIGVITELLGIPNADVAEFTHHGAAIGSALEGIRSLRHAHALMVADRALTTLFERLLDLRRREPRDDLVSALVAAEGEQIEPGELVPMLSLLLIAGFETTVNLIGNAVVALLDHPEQWRLLVEDPSLAGQAIDEVLRFDPPVQRTSRISFDDTEIAGQRVGRNQTINVLIGGTGRDPKVFDDPNRFDITRRPSTQVLAFSSGIHYCLGQPLAHLEAEIAVQQLAARFPGLHRVGPVRRRPATLIRGPLHLPLDSFVATPTAQPSAEETG